VRRTAQFATSADPVANGPVNPVAGADLIDDINAANDINIISIMRQYEDARLAKDEAERVMKDLKEQLTIGLGAIADVVHLDPDAYCVEIEYPDDRGQIERWRLGLQTNRYDRLSVPLLLSLGVTPDIITAATEHPTSTFTTVRRLKS